jgi:hypothetical protein
MSSTGRWSVLVKAPHGDVPAVFDLVESGSGLTGTLTRGGEAVAVADGRVTRDQLTWKCTVAQPVAGDLTFAATVAGNNIVGEVTGPTGVGKFSGSRE